MNFLNFIFMKIKKFVKGFFTLLLPYIIFFLFIVLIFKLDGFTWEDFGLDGFSLNPNDYCNLTDIKYTAILQDNPDGSASVEITEYLTFDVHAGSKSNTYKELWRELPEEYVDGLRVTYNVKSVSQILDNGQEIYYTETPKMYWEDYDFTENSTMYWHHSKGTGRYPDNDESVLIYIPWTYREKMTFKIVYTMNNAALKYNDCSELYLSMYSGNSITKLKSYEADILIPNKLMPSTYDVYTFGTAKSEIPYTHSTTKNLGYNTFSIDLDKKDLKFNYHNRYIEFCLLAYGKDKHIFTKYAPNNNYTSDNVLDECIEENEYYQNQNKKTNETKTIIFAVCVTISVFVVLGALKKVKEIKKKYNFHVPEIDYDIYSTIPSDLDPFFASQLVFMKHPGSSKIDNNEEYAAILLSLMRKKYVKIEKKTTYAKWEPHSTIITLEPITVDYSAQEDANINADNPFAIPIYSNINTITGEKLEPLSTSERLYYELLERHARRHYNNSITIHQLQTAINNDYEYTNAFINDMENKTAIEIGIMQGYFEPDIKYDTPKKELLNGANISLLLASILFVVSFFSYFSSMALCFGAYIILGLTLLWKNFYYQYEGSNFILFTQYGANEQAKWCGFYNFLHNEKFLKNLDVQDVATWEKYLIYATAFGISEKVVKSLKIHPIRVNIDKSLILNRRSYIHSRRHHRVSRSFGRSIHISSRGGGFGGHGYGGGGRRRRRWWRRPLIYKKEEFLYSSFYFIIKYY